MDQKEIEELKSSLEKELAELEEGLKTVSEKNPQNPKDWVAKPTDSGDRYSDDNDSADEVEAYGENAAILNELEVRYNNVKRALKKIEKGEYGICEISGESIEKERLKANPAARTCIKHKDEDPTSY